MNLTAIGHYVLVERIEEEDDKKSAIIVPEHIKRQSEHYYKGRITSIGHKIEDPPYKKGDSIYCAKGNGFDVDGQQLVAENAILLLIQDDTESKGDA